MLPSRRRTAPAARPRNARLLFLAALLGLGQLLVGFLAPPTRPDARAYPPLVARGGLVIYPVHEGFAPDGVYPITSREACPPGIERFGSWLGDNATTGRLETPWFPAGNGFELLVAGYPCTHGNSVDLELRRAGQEGGAAVRRRPLRFRDAHEEWVLQRIRLDPGELAAGPVEARLVARDEGTGPAGWLGISAPFREGRHTLLWSLGVLGRFALALGAAITAVVGAGLALRWRARGGGERRAPPWWASLALVPLPGAAWLVGIALVSWRLAPGVDPHLVAAVGLLPMFVLCAGVFARAPARELASATEWRVLNIALLILLLALTKATFSGGPVDELYGDTVSRTLEIGGRSDSRIAFHIVQLVTHGIPPFSPAGSQYFHPWGFSSRGPLPGLVSAPLVLAAGSRVPTTMPGQPWVPFDPEGFAVYRLAMMTLAAAALLPLFAAAGALLGGGQSEAEDHYGLWAVALAALAPFFLHEVYFTWGKSITAGCLAAAAYCLARRRFAPAGALVGVGYLCHPLALLYAPFFGLGAMWLARDPGPGSTPGEQARRGWGVALAAGLRFALPLLGILGFWRLVGLGDRGTSVGQSIFVQYIFMPSQREGFELARWARFRLESLLNTLVPFWLVAFDTADPELNPIRGHSPPVVHFFFQPWNTLPFGFGLLGFVPLCRRLWLAARARAAVFALAALGPLALFTLYWGASLTGMLREGLHPWFLSLVVLAASACPREGRLPAWETFLLTGRAVEVWLMCFLPTLLTFPALPRLAYGWLNAAALGLHLTCLGALTLLCFHVYRGRPAHQDNTTSPSPDPTASAAATPSTGPASVAGSGA